MRNLFKVDDGVLYWVFAETKEQVKELMKENYIQWYGSMDCMDAEGFDDMSITELPREDLFTYVFDSGNKAKLTVGEWLDLAHVFTGIESVDAHYFGCSEY